MKRAWSRKNLWENAPRWLKAPIGRAMSALPPAWLLGRTFRNTLALAHESQRWSAEQIRARQLEQLRRIVSIAAGSEYYREVFARCGFVPQDLQRPEDLRALPLIDKQTIRQNLHRMCVRAPDGGGVDEVSTGGSSGQPFKFYIDAGRSGAEFAYLCASWGRAGYKLGDITAVFRGSVVAPARDGLRHEYDPLLRRHAYSNFHMRDEEVRAYLAHVASLGPCYLLAYPSSAFALARAIERGVHLAPRNVKAILAGSEIVYDEQRAFCERVFGCRYFSWYGHSEKLVLAAECEHATDYHVWPLYGFCELVDDEGRPVTTLGQTGEIVGTGFINTVMPFIRYRTGDYATYAGDHCDACGRRHTLLRDICGHRTQEMLIGHDGSEISWVSLNMHDDTFDRVLQFQFRQDQPGEATLKLVTAEGFSDVDAQRILRNLDRKLAGQLRLRIERVDEIPLTTRGKSIFVDQRIDAAAQERQRSGMQETIAQAMPMRI